MVRLKTLGTIPPDLICMRCATSKNLVEVEAAGRDLLLCQACAAKGVEVIRNGKREQHVAKPKKAELS